MKRAAQGRLIKDGPRDGGRDEIDRHDVENGVGVARYSAPQAACVNLERPIHHFETGSDAGLRIADDDAGAQNDAGKGTEARAHQCLSLGFGLLVCIAIALAHGKFILAYKVRALACYISRTYISQAPQLVGAGSEIKHAASTLDINAAGLVK